MLFSESSRAEETANEFNEREKVKRSDEAYRASFKFTKAAFALIKQGLHTCSIPMTPAINT
jgi:hypothetical protein